MKKNSCNQKKVSLWERAHEIGPAFELVPGFSFDSDSKIKLYEYHGAVFN